MSSQLTDPSYPVLSRAELEVGRLIGCGGQASVEEARWSLERLYLKRPLPHLSSLEAQGLLKSELSALRALDEGRPCAARRLFALLSSPQGQLEGLLLRPYQGVSLKQLCAHSPALKANEVAYLMSELGRELDQAWRAGVVIHGDLSASNLMLSSGAELRLIDWALASLGPKGLASRPSARAAWRQEQASLGALIFRLTTGHRLDAQGDPFRANTLIEAGWPPHWASLLEVLLTGRSEPKALLKALSELWEPSASAQALEELRQEAQRSLGARVSALISGWEA